MESDAVKFIEPMLRACTSPVVVELGAQDGDDTKWLYKAAGAKAIYVALEPDPRNARLFRMNHGEKPILFFEAAIADYDGQATLHLCNNTCGQELASSSIHKPTQHLELFPWCTFEEQVVVPCHTLDTLFVRERLGHIDLLWVDVQGAEADMIRGGSLALAATKYLFMEAETKLLYEGQVLREDLLTMLSTWEVVQEYKWNLLLRNKSVL